MTFSQGEEESIILSMDGVGRYLDIGSYDGKTFSNIRALAERGWKGVCVEPAAYPFDVMVCDPPPGATLVNALVSDERGLTAFHYSRDALSTTSQAHRDRWADRVTFTPVYVAAITIEDLLERFPGPYRFISIDTETTSMSLFRKIVPLLDSLETEMVAVEHDGETPHIEGWRSVYRSGENEILQR